MSSRENTPKVNSKKKSLNLRRKRNPSESTIKNSLESKLEKSVSESFVENTPVNTRSLTPQTQSAPPNFRPYRLSLNKRLRETMTKKRLEFHLALEKESSKQTTDNEEVPDTEQFNETIVELSDQEEVAETDIEDVPETEVIEENTAKFVENEEILETEEFRDSKLNPTENTESQKENTSKKQVSKRKVLKRIEIVEEEMQAHQEHIAKTQELQSEITRWSHSFHRNVNELKTSIEPFKNKFIAMNQNGIKSLYKSD